MENNVVYVGGDMLLKGSQLLREIEKKRLKELGFTPYAPQDDEEINDKKQQTEDSNNGLAEKIFNKDTKAMLNADILIFEVSNNNVGTTTEIGQWAMVHRLAKIVDDPMIQLLAKKPIFFHSTDVRDTDIPESNWRRSHSYNQYLIGAILEINQKGIQTWEEIESELNVKTKQSY
ncbi:nucleoside 2-deoxyribosyltransferase [Enterococcus mundtii]|uniref:nucleoside 2-deoxyribosyltransferase n=1 Tax=Enterococcus mundtii TaxID=53346 RepID=UPI001A966E30|nr:nucleoside 2-deoxyribosyltransferase [Enterococcus mundtii]